MEQEPTPGPEGDGAQRHQAEGVQPPGPEGAERERGQGEGGRRQQGVQGRHPVAGQHLVGGHRGDHVEQDGGVQEAASQAPDPNPRWQLLHDRLSSLQEVAFEHEIRLGTAVPAAIGAGVEIRPGVLHPGVERVGQSDPVR